MLIHIALLGALTLPSAPSTPTDTLSAAGLLRPGPGSILLGPSGPISPPAHRTAATPTSFIADREVHPAPVGPVRPGVAFSPFSVTSDPDEPRQMIEYSDAYFTRLTIHKWASYLTLPLFVSEYIVGQKLINGEGSESLRGVHGALAGGIGALFVVNTVTGGWNAIEGWKDPEGRTRRTLHSALMLLADAGFVVTASLANEREDEGGAVGPVDNTNHRRAAIASMSTALVGYAIMLPFFGGS